MLSLHVSPRRILRVLGILGAGAVVTLGTYAGLIELSCRGPWKTTQRVRDRLKPGMTPFEVLAAANEVQGAQPAITNGTGTDGPVHLFVASGFECQCFVPLHFAAGRVVEVGDAEAH